MAEPILAVEGLTRRFGDFTAVSELSFEIQPGEIFGFLGPNGAGKTTAIKMLLGLVHPTSGMALLLGLPPQDMRAKQRVGFLPELFRFHEWLTAEQFLDFHGRLYGIPKEKLRRRIPEVLDLVGLRSEAGSLLRTFSKGMQQRIGLAQAILNDPDVVLLDEPTSALDPLGRRDVRDLMRFLKSQGRTVFLNSHLLSEVEMVCDRVAIIDRGRVIATGPLEELLASVVEVEIDAAGLSPAAMEELGGLGRPAEGSNGRMVLRLPDRESIPAVAEVVVRHGGRLYSLQQRRGSLEELFIRVVEQEGAR